MAHESNVCAGTHGGSGWYYCEEMSKINCNPYNSQQVIGIVQWLQADVHLPSMTVLRDEQRIWGFIDPINAEGGTSGFMAVYGASRDPGKENR